MWATMSRTDTIGHRRSLHAVVWLHRGLRWTTAGPAPVAGGIPLPMPAGGPFADVGGGPA